MFKIKPLLFKYEPNINSDFFFEISKAEHKKSFPSKKVKDLKILELVKQFIILFETKFPKLKTVKLFKFCLMRKRKFKIQASNRIFEEKIKQRSAV